MKNALASWVCLSVNTYVWDIIWDYPIVEQYSRKMRWCTFLSGNCKGEWKTVVHNNHTSITRRFLIMIPIKSWLQTKMVQQLWRVEAYAYFSLKIRPEHMKAFLHSHSPMYVVCFVQSEKLRLIVSYIQSSLYARLRSDSARDIVYRRVMWLERSSEVLCPIVLVIRKHHCRRAEIKRRKIWQSEEQFCDHNLKPCLRKLFLLWSFFRHHWGSCSVKNGRYLW